jgi:hypothetical protein
MELSAAMQEECSSHHKERNNMIDITDPVIIKAMELAQALSIHCKEHNLPAELVIDGVAPDALAVAKGSKEKGYLEGKAYEKGRISELLGLTR